MSEMSKYERQTLAEMATTYRGCGYCWRKASVAKLVKRGFAAPLDDRPGYFQITAAGREAYAALP